MSRPLLSEIPWWAWIGAAASAALLVARLSSSHQEENALGKARPPAQSQGSHNATERRQLADAVYLRFIEDEGPRSPLEKLQRAIEGVARARNLEVGALKRDLQQFAASIEAEPHRNSYELTVAAVLRGDFERAAREVSTTNNPATALPYSGIDLLSNSLARIQALTLAGKYDEAERGIADAERSLNRTREPEAWARVQAARYFLLWSQGRSQEALRLARIVLEVRESCLPADSPGIANAKYNLGVSLSQEGQASEAIPLLTQALASYAKTYGAEDLQVGETASELADALLDAGRLPEAEAAAKRAAAVLEHTGDASDLRLALALDRLGLSQLEQKHYAEAEVALRRAVGIYDRRNDARAKDHSDAVHRLGLAIARQDRRREALPYLRRSTEIGSKWYRPDDPLYAVLFHNLGVWSDAAGDDPGTVAAYEKALQILAANRRRTGHEPAQLAQTREFYAAYLKRAGRSESEIARQLKEATR